MTNTITISSRVKSMTREALVFYSIPIRQRRTRNPANRSHKFRRIDVVGVFGPIPSEIVWARFSGPYNPHFQQPLWGKEAVGVYG